MSQLKELGGFATVVSSLIVYLLVLHPSLPGVLTGVHVCMESQVRPPGLRVSLAAVKRLDLSGVA